MKRMPVQLELTHLKSRNFVEMRFCLALLNVLVFCSTIHGHEVCPGRHSPLCGKNGTCYTTFANECIRNLFNRQQAANSLKLFVVVQRTACTPREMPLCKFRQMTNWSFSESLERSPKLVSSIN